MLQTRVAEGRDAERIAAIYNEGIDGRGATFETRHRGAGEVSAWITGAWPVVVVERQGEVVGFAAAFPYSDRPCYRGIAEFSVYVSTAARQGGVGRAAVQALLEALRAAGCWKLVSRIFPHNEGSRRLLAQLGFREVGVYRNHARLDGHWRDVIIVEYLLD